MPKRSCPSCNRRLPYAARRCLHCQWSLRAGRAGEDGGSLLKRGRVWMLVLLLAALVGGGAAYRNADSIAFWYANFAARHLPSSLSSFAPTDTDAGAFFFCARQVARSMDGEFSVETFPSLDQSRSVTLGERRYQIRSFVDEAREDGARIRHSFVCTVQYARGRWVLEDLKMASSLADASDAEQAPGLQSDR
jgi:hypothetical protein